MVSPLKNSPAVFRNPLEAMTSDKKLDPLRFVKHTKMYCVRSARSLSGDGGTVTIFLIVSRWTFSRSRNSRGSTTVITASLSAGQRLVPPVIDSAENFRIDGSAMTEMHRDRETGRREEVRGGAQR